MQSIEYLFPEEKQQKTLIGDTVVTIGEEFDFHQIEVLSSAIACYWSYKLSKGLHRSLNDDYKTYTYTLELSKKNKLSKPAMAEFRAFVRGVLVGLR